MSAHSCCTCSYRKRTGLLLAGILLITQCLSHTLADELATPDPYGNPLDYALPVLMMLVIPLEKMPGFSEPMENVPEEWMATPKWESPFTGITLDHLKFLDEENASQAKIEKFIPFSESGMPLPPEQTSPIVVMMINNENSPLLLPGHKPPPDPNLGLINSAGGSGDPDYDPHTSDFSQELDERPDRRMQKFRQQVKRVRFYQPIQRYLLVHKLLNFVRLYPSYSKEAYELIGRLLNAEAITYEILMRTGQALALSLSSFPNTGIALGRSALIVGSGTVGTVIPWLFTQKAWVGNAFLFVGWLMLWQLDNGMAHLSHSPYAMDWMSREHFNYGVRTGIVLLLQLKILKDGYGMTLVPFIVDHSRGHLRPVVITDFALKTMLSYVGIAAAIGGFPYFCVACGPNPYGPWDYPISNYCPSVPWVPWPMRCNDKNIKGNHTGNATLIEAQ